MHQPTLFRNRKFTRFFVGRSIDLLGNAMTPVAITLGVLQATHSATRTGIIVAANVVPTLIFMLLGGVLADRFPRSKILVITCLLAALSQLGMAFFLFAANFSLLPMVLLAAFSGFINSFSGPALRGVITDLVPAQSIQVANAALSSSKNAAKIIGPTIAAVLVGFAGGGWALIVDATTFLIAAALFYTIPGTAKPRQTAPIWQDFSEGWRTYYKLRWVWILGLSYAAINLALVGPWQILGPVIIQESSQTEVWGAILSFRALAIFVSSLILVKIRLRNPLVAGLILGALTALPLFALGLKAPLPILFLSVAVAGFGIATSGITYDTALQTAVPADRISRVISFDELIAFATVPLSQLLAGPLSALTSPYKMLLFCGALVTVLHFLPLLSPTVRTVTAGK